MSRNINQRQKSAFREIIKGTAIFGGTQMVSMLSGLVRGKFLAIILGAHGMGVSSLLASAIQPVQQFFAMGLPSAAVSSIAHATDETEQRQRATALRRSTLLLALAAAAFLIISASLLSSVTFGTDTDYTLWFAALAAAVFFNMLAACENTILQSFRQLKALALCNIVTAAAGVLISIPILYVMGIEGIVPSMIVLALVSWAFARWHTLKLRITTRQQWTTTFALSRKMIMLGMTMMVAALLGSLSVYAVNTFINISGTTEHVAFYQTASVITVQCTTMVFTALATDYYPHLTQVIADRIKMLRLINQQSQVVMLLTAPVAALLMVFAPVVVRVLFTSEFDIIVPLVQMMSFAFLMRAYYFPLDYICLAKGDKAFFFCIEGIWTNAKMLLLFIGGYHLFGLSGLGYAAIANGLLDAVMSTVMVRWRYGVAYSPLTMAVVAVNALLVAAVMAVTLCVEDNMIKWMAAGVLTLVITINSLIQIKKRTGTWSIRHHR